MNVFLGNIVLALSWAALIERFTPVNLIIGFGLGYLILWFLQPITGASNYFVKMRQVLSFLLFFLWKLVLANLRVAYDVVTPKHHMRPGVVAVPLEAQTDLEISLLANLITLTPGTLSLDVSDDRRVLYIHAMYIDHPDALQYEIKQGFERRLLEVLR